ncbi:hypothetical protein BCR42DRAFT_22273 [Absidia repens]|uniref:Uncharacterized protein n=1 Tax=Absidia repens TaxID=90262 RepID=A0A1X2IHS6_9FUNG|nr:hypothetical protein BCR42DRAFT_22273 [Absidia repens]
MPPSGPRIPKRRGRPKRKGQQMQAHQRQHLADDNGLNYSAGLDISMREIQEHRHQPLSSSHSTTTFSVYDRPREERSYKDFYPDLNIKQTLSIIRRTRVPCSDKSVPLMNDTTIMTGISTVPVDTANTALLHMNTNTETSQPPGDLDNVSGLTHNGFLNDTTICSTSLGLLEHTPAIPPTINKNLTTAEIASYQFSSSPIMTHGSKNELDTYHALATRSPDHSVTNSGTVDLTNLPNLASEK